MATTNSNFLAVSASGLTGSGYAVNGVLLALPAALTGSFVGNGLGTVLDRIATDLSKAGFALNGGVILNLAISTPHTIDLTALSSETVTAGDLVFATWKQIILVNLGLNPVTVSPGASNPIRSDFVGTGPGRAVRPGAWDVWFDPAGKVVDSTHKTITFDPGAFVAQIAVFIGGG